MSLLFYGLAALIAVGNLFGFAYAVREVRGPAYAKASAMYLAIRCVGLSMLGAVAAIVQVPIFVTAMSIVTIAMQLADIPVHSHRREDALVWITAGYVCVLIAVTIAAYLVPLD